jgi:hypothetical protein
MNIELREINRKFLDADAIDDEELGALLKFYVELSAMMDGLGPEFKLALNEIIRRRESLRLFAFHRR